VIAVPLSLVLALAPQQARRAPAPRPLRIASIEPARNALNVARTTEIRVHFDQAVAPSSLSAQSFHVLGRWSGITPGTTTFEDSFRTLVFVPDEPFSAGETVTVTLSKAVKSAFGGSLAAGHAWSFWTDSDPGAGTWTQVGTLIPGNTPYGAYGGDIDGDGDLDLCIPNEDTSDVSVFLNQGGGTFGPDVRYAVGFHCSPSEAADLDFDGKLDLAVANILDHDMSVLMGNGDGTFQPQTRHVADLQPRGLCLLDVDGDGDHDAVTANRVGDTLALFVNLGAGNFGPAVTFDGGGSGETGVATADMNDDGQMDVVAINYTSGSVGVLLGNGNGGFLAPIVSPIGMNPWMVVTGDVNSDGHNDVAVALSGQNRAAVALGNGTGALAAPVLYPVGSFPIAIDLGDLDADGDLDLTASCYGGGRFDVYRNDGTGAMGTHTTLPAILAGSCTVLHDVDGDGDVDITAIDEIADRVLLYDQND
jgi:hypothetical protein